MSEESHTLLVLPRGRRGELRITRERYEGHSFTRLHIWFPSEPHGELRPSRQSVKIRDSELPELIAVLQRIERRIAAGSARQSSTATPRRTGDRPPPRRPTADELDDQEVF